MAAQLFDGNDRAVIQNLVAKEVAVLARIGTDIEHAVDVQVCQQFAQMQREVALLHLAQWHDVVAERPADPENRVLDDLEHDDLRGPADPKSVTHWRCEPLVISLGSGARAIERPPRMANYRQASMLK